MPDALKNRDVVYLAKLKLAIGILLELGEDDTINNIFESELWAFQDRVDHALLTFPGGPEKTHGQLENDPPSGPDAV